MYSVTLTAGSTESIQYVTRAFSFLHQWSVKHDEEVWANELQTDSFLLRTIHVNIYEVQADFDVFEENALSDDNDILSEEEVEKNVGGAQGKRGFGQAKKDRRKGKKALRQGMGKLDEAMSIETEKGEPSDPLESPSAKKSPAEPLKVTEEYWGGTTRVETVPSNNSTVLGE